MHGLDTIRHLNERALRQCEHCKKYEEVALKRIVHDVTIDGKKQRVCGPCIAIHVSKVETTSVIIEGEHAQAS